jgi:hypothetical protein
LISKCYHNNRTWLASPDKSENPFAVAGAKSKDEANSGSSYENHSFCSKKSRPMLDSFKVHDAGIT